MSRRIRLIATPAGIAVAAAALMSCGYTGSEQAASDSSLRQESITLDDGRTVQCVLRSSGYKGGLSCDWAGAK